MFTQTVSSQLGTLVSVELADAFTDFVLSRQAMQCTKAKMEFYRYFHFCHGLTPISTTPLTTVESHQFPTPHLVG